MGPVTTAKCAAWRHLLRSALENVVRNAVRYTTADSEVQIEIGSRVDSPAAQRYATIKVRDHGPGVPPSALGDLFRPFYRVSEARDRQSGGTGLGLAITRQAIDAHAGRVSAANHPEGGLLVEIELALLSGRRRWDSNPRNLSALRFFKTDAIDRSATPPSKRPHFVRRLWARCKPEHTRDGGKRAWLTRPRKRRTRRPPGEWCP